MTYLGDLLAAERRLRRTRSSGARIMARIRAGARVIDAVNQEIPPRPELPG
jgi:hypothetical protein